MKRTNRPVTSREYKLMLNPERFSDRARGTELFWDLATFLVEKQGNRIYEKQDETLRRRTWYLDTPGFDLHRQGATLRVRDEERAKKRFQITLKYRNADRYVSAAQDLASTVDIAVDDYKFEEDILPPFASGFAHSVSFKTKKLPPLATTGDLVVLFPGLAQLSLPGATPIEIAHHFTAHEIAHRIGKFQFDKMPVARGDKIPNYVVKACLTFWYLLGKENEIPLVVEFSFDYDVLGVPADEPHALEEFSPTVVAGTNRFFRDLQKQTGWLAGGGTTKTAYAFEDL